LRKATKIIVIILLAAGAVVLVHLLPGFESFIRKIHGY